MEDEPTVEQQELAFVAAGDRLRDAREKKNLTLQQLAAETRIPMRHLEAIEAGSFASLPGRTYAIGFSRSYAKVVGLDEAEIVELVRAELGESDPAEAYGSGGMEPGDAAKLPSSNLAWFGAIGAVLLVAGLIAFYTTYFAAGQGPASLLSPDDTAIADADQAGQQAAAAAVPAAINPDGAVVFTALEDGVWARFYEFDGERLFEKQMASGEQFELPSGAEDPRINTGRPDAFAITIDGRAVPKLSDEPITIGDAAISAAALLARAEPEGTTSGR